MHTYQTRYILIAVLIAALVAVCAQSSMGQSTDLTVQSKAISFASGVLGIDVSKYTVVSTRYISDQVPPLNGVSQGQFDMTFASTAGNITMTSSFVNGTLVHCVLYDSNGSTPSPRLVQPVSTDINAATLALLQRYQNYTKSSYIQPMINLLTTSSISIAVPSTIVGNNLKMVVSPDGNETTVSWKYSVNGIDYPNSLTIDYYNGSVKAFTDWWNLFTVGSTSVKVQEPQVVTAALDQANSVSTVPISGIGDVKINLVGTPDIVQLYGAVRSNLTAYPFWYIHFPTDKNYYSVDGIEVGIWADTGQVAYCQITGHHGFAPGDQLAPNATASQTNNAALSESYLAEVAVAAVLSALVSIAVVATKKRRRRGNR